MSKLNILICAATPFELLPIDQYLQKQSDDEEQKVNFHTFVHGVGIPTTVFSMTRLLSQRSFNLIIQMGIGGSLDKEYPPGSVVQVIEESFVDLGAEEKDGSLLNLFDMELLEPNTPPFSNGKITFDPAKEYSILPKVKGGTVNLVSGTEGTISRNRAKYPGLQVESMEGAAAAYVCKSLDLPFLQIRGISNFVEPRNRKSWELEKAMTNLTNVVIEMMEEIKKANVE